jgi:hypothetical protein
MRVIFNSRGGIRLWKLVSSIGVKEGLDQVASIHFGKSRAQNVLENFFSGSGADETSPA